MFHTFIEFACDVDTRSRCTFRPSVGTAPCPQSIGVKGGQDKFCDSDSICSHVYCLMPLIVTVYFVNGIAVSEL
jgi:hypothetical protein